jgi:hypothetical protein
MILALALLLAQTVPAPADDPEAAANEIVVQAVYGRTTMLFDKGADGKLHNCRIMVSSGSQKRDTAACQATPVCFYKTADEVTDCVPFTSLESVAPVAAAAPKPLGNAEKFDLGVARLKPVIPAVGPSLTAEENRESERQRVKLPPLPKADNGPPAITLSGPQPDPQNSGSPFEKPTFEKSPF